ncbi:MAG: helix-turn-helix domain-containing protein [Ruminococcaceae bacterium]|nr:helix-turn-helix domain-containing protein [Oscillospiraceae bacterium]
MEYIPHLQAKDHIYGDNVLVVQKKRLEEKCNLHWHNFFEFDLILEGKGYQNFNGKEYPLEKGVGYILKPTDFHEMYVSTPLTFYNIMFNENALSDHFIETLLNTSEDILTTLTPPVFEHISYLTHILDTEFNENNPFKESCIHNLSETLLMMFMRACNLIPRGEYVAATPIKKSLLYIHTHFRENPTLSVVATVSGFSANYFSEIFHQHTGQTYKEYITNLKLNYAKHLLKQNKMTSTDVCFECGFSSLSNFLKAFKKQFGVTPQEYAHQ